MIRFKNLDNPADGPAEQGDEKHGKQEGANGKLTPPTVFSRGPKGQPPQENSTAKRHTANQSEKDEKKAEPVSTQEAGHQAEIRHADEEIPAQPRSV
jgi:hypothetical protein